VKCTNQLWQKLTDENSFTESNFDLPYIHQKVTYQSHNSSTTTQLSTSFYTSAFPLPVVQ
jgi:hypothetical protein